MKIYNWFCRESYHTKKLPEKLYARLHGDILEFHRKEDFNTTELADGDVIGVYHLQNSKTAKVVLE